jgi:hypothetical protein
MLNDGKIVEENSVCKEWNWVEAERIITNGNNIRMASVYQRGNE